MRYIFILCILLFISCNLDDQRENLVTEGLRPVYSNDWKTISVEPAREIGQLGKIYYHEGWLFVNELYQGIHVFDNTNLASPEPTAFISIPGNVDIAAKGDVIYADNYMDLVSIRIPSNDQLEVLSRTSNLYPEASQSYPPLYSGYFECVDLEKGVVIGWEEATLSNPKCKR